MTTQTSTYEQQALDFLKATGATFTASFLRHGSMNWDKDGQTRDIYKCTLSRGKRSYSFEFGQSLNKSAKGRKGMRIKPTAYDVLACIQTYEVGTFEDFCSDFGYDSEPLSEYPRVHETYEAVKNEFTQVHMLFSDSEIELLREIN